VLEGTTRKEREETVRWRVWKYDVISEEEKTW
jgi:hypothetical protein